MPIRDVLVDRIGGVLTDNLNEFDFDAVDAMVRVNYERKAKDENAAVAPDDKRAVLAFTLELPDETASARTVLMNFVMSCGARSTPAGRIWSASSTACRWWSSN